MTQPYREEGEIERRFYLGTNCHVLCIDQDNGSTIWQTELRSSINSSLVTLLLYQGRIFAANWRSVACLDADDGKRLWDTQLKKLAEPASLALDLQAPGVPGGQLLVGGGGWIYGLSAESGALRWQNDLPGLGYHPLCMRVPGAIIAQPTTRYVSKGNTVVAQVLENNQT